MTSCSPNPRLWETKASDVTGRTMEACSGSGSHPWHFYRVATGRGSYGWATTLPERLLRHGVRPRGSPRTDGRMTSERTQRGLRGPAPPVSRLSTGEDVPHPDGG